MSYGKRIISFSRPFISNKEIKAVEKVIKSGWWTTGKVSQAFEESFSKYIGCRYAIALNSATAALHLALKAIGVGKGDEVIVPTMTFAATAEVVIHCQAKPVLCDCEADALNIDIEDLKRKVSKRTKVIIPVHMAGLPCKMDEVRKIARVKNIYVVEDAAHALGAEYKNKMVGMLGDLAAFSFYVTKPIAAGEGGMLVTNNKRFAELARSLSLHGLSHGAWDRYSGFGSPSYKIIHAGFKYNMPDILAAIGLYQLKKANYLFEIREGYSKKYTKAFSNNDLIEIPICPKGLKHAWHLYIIKLKLEKLNISRDKFMQKLRNEGVCASVHFMPLHMQPFYKKNFKLKNSDFPNATSVSKRIVSLPLYSAMKISDIEFIVSKVNKILEQARKK